MNEPDYKKIITALDAAKTVLAANAGHLNPADLRIRSLVNIIDQEAQRALQQLAAETAFGAAPAGHSRSPGKE